MVAAVPSMPIAIAFRDASHGALATTRDVELTDDGGRTWRVVIRTRDATSVGFDEHGRLVVRRAAAPTPPPCHGMLFRGFASGRWALCIGEGGAGAMGKAVYRHAASGWRLLAATPFPPPGRARGGLSIMGYPEGIAMAPDGFGVIWESRGTLYVTHDGGAVWEALPHVAVPEVDFGISGAALPGGRAWVLLARGFVHRRLLETTDAGRTWHVVHRWR